MSMIDFNEFGSFEFASLLRAVENENMSEIERFNEEYGDKIKQYSPLFLTNAIIKSSGSDLLDFLISRVDLHARKGMYLDVAINCEHEEAFRKIIDQDGQGKLTKNMFESICKIGTKEMFRLALMKYENPYFNAGHLIRVALEGNKKHVVEHMYEGAGFCAKEIDEIKEFLRENEIENASSDYFLKKCQVDEFKEMARAEIKALNKKAKPCKI